ncbi:MAG: hypothetical protein FWC73_02120 [Defluviitaleaceae bacterium]|nr:hypothetical protein [Defluviitaleaceae bacterium]
MASAVSYEYLKSIMGAPGGIPTLDGDGEIPSSQLPPTVVSPFRGAFTDVAALTTAHPTAGIADFAFVNSSLSFWYWNRALTAGMGKSRNSRRAIS